MSWCDKLASTPVVGFKLNFHYSPPDELFEAFSPIIDAVSQDGKPKFNINQYEIGGVAFTTHEGFKYTADHSKISVGFEHILRTRVVSAGPPIMEMLSQPRPFSKLLPVVAEKVIEATLLLNEFEPRTVHRVGIVSVTKIAEDELPPGIKRFFSYMARPWKHGVESFQYHTLANLGAGSGWTDRCVNTVVKPDEEPEEPLSLLFDWQRMFTEGRSVTLDALRELLADAQEAAMTYFEELAEGSQFDEDLIRSTVSA